MCMDLLRGFCRLHGNFTKFFHACFQYFLCFSKIYNACMDATWKTFRYFRLGLPNKCRAKAKGSSLSELSCLRAVLSHFFKIYRRVPFKKNDFSKRKMLGFQALHFFEKKNQNIFSKKFKILVFRVSSCDSYFVISRIDIDATIANAMNLRSLVHLAAPKPPFAFFGLN